MHCANISHWYNPHFVTHQHQISPLPHLNQVTHLHPLLPWNPLLLFLPTTLKLIHLSHSLINLMSLVALFITLHIHTYLTNSHPMQTRGRNCIFKPKIFLSTTMSMSLHSEPKTVKETLALEIWKIAMLEEYTTLMKNGTWSLVPPSSNCSLVRNKWVSCVKTNPDGSIAKYKAHLLAQGFHQISLVAKGFHQIPRLDFEETFSHVIKHSTLHVVLAFVVSKNWTIRQIDINMAFYEKMFI